MNISFSGCGFLGIYHVGVIQAFREHAPSMLDEFKVVAGASAGAIASLVVVSGCPAGRIHDSFITTAEKARASWTGPFSPSFDCMAILHGLMDETLPANIHRLASDRLHVSLTAVPSLKNRIVSHFNTRLELIKAIKATCYIPVWAGLQRHTYRGETYMDGGVSNNLPTDFEGETITVSPFSGEADICPTDQQEGWDMSFNLSGTSIRMTWSNAFRLKSALFPPKPASLERMFESGYRDCLRFMRKRGFIPEVVLDEPSLSNSELAENALQKLKRESRLSRQNSVVSIEKKPNGLAVAVRLTLGQLLLLPHTCTDVAYAAAILLAIKAKHIVVPDFADLQLDLPEMGEPVDYSQDHPMLTWTTEPSVQSTELSLMPPLPKLRSNSTRSADSGISSPAIWELSSNSSDVEKEFPIDCSTPTERFHFDLEQ